MVAAAVEPYSLLIADDDKACLDALRDVFEPEGYRTHLASSGITAIQVVRRHRIHVVMVDMQMPGMTGLETISLIRQRLALEIPCVLMSGAVNDDLERRALEAHVYTFMRKPLDLPVVRGVVADIVREFYS